MQYRRSPWVRLLVASAPATWLLWLTAAAGCNLYDPGLLERRKPGFVTGLQGDGGQQQLPGVDGGTDGPVAIDPADDGGLPAQAHQDTEEPEPDAGTPGQAGDALDPLQDAGAGGDPGVVVGGDQGDDGEPTGDACLHDDDKTEPGLCGCGVPDTGSGSCTDLQSALAHRYRFDGTGTALVDTIAGDDGVLTGTTLAGQGALSLVGDDGHGTLPAQLVGSLSTATVELWFTRDAGQAGQQLFSFGTARPTTVTTTSQPDCQETPRYREGSWYLRCAQQVDWRTARGHCEGAGGALVALADSAEAQFVESLLADSSWLAANDLEMEGRWAWASAGGPSAGGTFWTGGTVAPGAYAKWRAGQPDNAQGAEHCAYLSVSDWRWNDNSCLSTWPFTCEWQGHRGASMDSGLAFSPETKDQAAEVRLAFEGTTVRAMAPAVPIGVSMHVTVVLDPGGHGLALYLDGQLHDTVAFDHPLQSLRDVDAWIGRSHVASDPAFRGSVRELRIYDRALSAAEVASSHLLGSDPAFLE